MRTSKGTKRNEVRTHIVFARRGFALNGCAGPRLRSSGFDTATRLPGEDQPTHMHHPERSANSLHLTPHHTTTPIYQLITTPTLYPRRRTQHPNTPSPN